MARLGSAAGLHFVMRCLSSIPLLLLLACGSLTSPSEVWQVQLDVARTRWAANGLTEYEYVYAFQCGECLPEARREIQARVRDGELIALYYLRFPGGDVPTQDGPWTIPEQFDRIQGYIDGGARTLEVEYHPANGVPLSVSVDPIPDAVDDEHGFTITGFGGIPVPAALVP
jgi:hypothetical protein